MKPKKIIGKARLKYLRASTWSQNPFWDSPLYSEKSKEYFNEWLARMVREEKNLSTIQ